MSRNVSNTFKSAAYGSHTSEAYIVLITIDHDEMDEPINVTS